MSEIQEKTWARNREFLQEDRGGLPKPVVELSLAFLVMRSREFREEVFEIVASDVSNFPASRTQAPHLLDYKSFDSKLIDFLPRQPSAWSAELAPYAKSAQ